ncbi:MAG TPA: vWA domain-containing protein, partial [Planctomycetota bacterium]|nr:vWA domain-containing protein [Planctomycetota bacterium]
MLTFAAPALAMAAPLALALVLAALRRGRLPLPRGRRWAAGAARGLLVLLLGAALARPVLTVAAEKPFLTVFAVDVSESVGGFPEAPLRDAWTRALADGGTCALVAFAGRAEVRVPPTRRPLPDPLPEGRDRLQPSSTNFPAALAAARGLFREDATSRLVLVTDGRSPSRSAAELAIPPGTRAVRADRASGADVAVIGVQAPAAVPAGEPFDVRVTLEASGPAEATLTLSVDDAATPEARRTIRIERAGRSTVLMPNVQQKSALSAGLHRLLVLAEVPGDAESRNNAGQAAFAVTGRPRVLLVEGRPADGELPARIFKAQDIDFDRRSPAAADPDAFEQYAAVVLAGVPRSQLPAAALERLEAYVRRSGGGLFVLGAEALQGTDGYAGSPLEGLLPVRFSDAPPAVAKKPPSAPPVPTPPP